MSKLPKDARARSTAEQTDDDHHPAHDRQLSGAGREEPSPRADGRGAPARRSGRSPVRSFASYGGGINCARRIQGRAARNQVLFGTDLSFLSNQKIPTILERRPPWPLLRPLRRIWENGYHSLAWHPRAKLPPGP